MRDDDLGSVWNDAEQYEVLSELHTTTASFVTSLGCGEFMKPTETTTAEVDTPTRIGESRPSSVIESTPCRMTIPYSTTTATNDRILRSEYPTPPTPVRRTWKKWTVTEYYTVTEEPEYVTLTEQAVVRIKPKGVTEYCVELVKPDGATETMSVKPEDYPEYFTGYRGFYIKDYTGDIITGCHRTSSTMTNSIAIGGTGHYTSCHPSTVTTRSIHTPITTLSNCDSTYGFDTALSYHTGPSIVHNTVDTGTRFGDDDASASSVGDDVKILRLCTIACILAAGMSLVMCRKPSLRNSLMRALGLGIISGSVTLWILCCEKTCVIVRLGLAGIDAMRAYIAGRLITFLEKLDAEGTADILNAAVNGISQLYERNFPKNPAATVACVMGIIVLYKRNDSIECVAVTVAIPILMIELLPDSPWLFTFSCVGCIVGIAGISLLIRLGFAWGYEKLFPANWANVANEKWRTVSLGPYR